MLTRVPYVKIRIAVVERNALLREGLKALLSAEPDFEVVGDFTPGLAAVEAIGRLQPEIVLTDLDAPHALPIDYLVSLIQAAPRANLVVLTDRRAEATAKRAFAAGIRGYLLKDSSSAGLMATLRGLAADDKPSDELARPTFPSPGLKTTVETPGAPLVPALTGRERQILTQVALGESNKGIARTLTLSVKTVEKHRGNLMRKLKLRNAAAITLYAVRNGLAGPNAG